MMIGRRPIPLIGKLAGVWGSGGNSGSGSSPKIPLEIMKIQSPKVAKKYEFVGGVGLGIVAALEHAHISKHVPAELEYDEEGYTLVICHGANKINTTSTRVYYDDGSDHHRHDGVSRKSNIGVDCKNVKKKDCVKFHISPPRIPDQVADFPGSDFLNFCNTCRKTLHDKDVYMYRGEKAFCSTECRYVEIVKDERKEKQNRNSNLVASRSTTGTAATDHSSTTFTNPANRLISATSKLAS